MKIEVPDYDVKSKLSVKPENFVLLVVDMQNDFVHPEGVLYNPEAEKTTGPLNALIERARAADLPVWYTRDTHAENDPEFEIWGEHCVRDSFGWRIHEQLTPESDDLVFDKAEYDGFYETELEQELENRSKSGLIIAGTVANICVHYTAASAGLRDFDVVHPVDLVSALTEFGYHAALRQASWLFQARLVESSGLVFQ